MEGMTQLWPPRCPGLSLGTRDAGMGEEIGRMGVGVSFSQGTLGWSGCPCDQSEEIGGRVPIWKLGDESLHSATAYWATLSPSLSLSGPLGPRQKIKDIINQYSSIVTAH